MPACCLCIACIQSLWGSEKGVKFPETGVTDGCVLPCGAGNRTHILLREQSVLIRLSPLQPSPHSAPPKKIPLRDKAHDFSCLSGRGNWWSHLALYFWFYSKEKFRFRAWLTWTEETNEFNVSLQHRRGFRFWLDHKRRLTDPENSRICNYDLIDTILYKRSVCVTIFVSNN